jgi:hypothetical protein
MPAIVVNGQADSNMSVHKASRSKEPVKPFHVPYIRANCGILMAATSGVPAASAGTDTRDRDGDFRLSGTDHPAGH